MVLLKMWSLEKKRGEPMGTENRILVARTLEVKIRVQRTKFQLKMKKCWRLMSSMAPVVNSNVLQA